MEQGYVGSIISSPDGGVTWTYPTDPGGRWIIPTEFTSTAIGNAVAWTGSVWVVTGVWLTNSISFSEDGINFQKIEEIKEV